MIHNFSNDLDALLDEYYDRIKRDEELISTIQNDIKRKLFNLLTTDDLTSGQEKFAQIMQGQLHKAWSRIEQLELAELLLAQERRYITEAIEESVEEGFYDQRIENMINVDRNNNG